MRRHSMHAITTARAVHGVTALRRCRTLARCHSVLVTTPIYYVNSSPHLGHVYSSVLADALARWARIRDDATARSVLLSTGTDEHGQKVTLAARAAAAATPPPSAADDATVTRAFVDRISNEYRAAADAFNVGYTSFIRTSSPSHIATVQWLWRRLVSRGAIALGAHSGWYCTPDEAFLTDAQTCTRAEYVAGRGGDVQALSASQRSQRVSIESGHAVEWLSESNYMFRLSALQQPLMAWLDSSPAPVYPAQRLNEVKAFVSAGLKDLSVSRRRDKVPWAIPVPGDDSHSVYVWLDALANYLTAARGDVPLTDDVDPHAAFPAWPAHTHVVGKDILRFHAVYWPAFLLAAGLPLPQRIVAHGHWTVQRTKMSKSLGNVVNPMSLIPPAGTLPVDAVRYFMLHDGSIGGDGDFSMDALRVRAVAECADTLGNLAARALTASFLPQGRLPRDAMGRCMALADVLRALQPAEAALVDRLKQVGAQVAAAYDAADVPRAVDAAMSVAMEANRMFANAEPWKLRTDAAAAERYSAIMYVTLEALRIAAILLQPVMPTAAPALLQRLGVPDDTASRAAPAAVYGAILPEAYNVSVHASSLVLFPKPMPAPSASATSSKKQPRVPKVSIC